VDLVDEEHVAGLEIREQRRQITWALDRRAARHPQLSTHLRRDDVREGGLAEPGRAVEQQMIERLLALARRTNEDTEVLAQAVLTDHLIERTRAQTLLDTRLARLHGGLDIPSRVLLHAHDFTSILSEPRTRSSSVGASPEASTAPASARSAWDFG